MSGSEDLAIFNAVIPHAVFGSSRHVRLEDEQLPLTESGLDSMDVAIVGAYLCELFDVPVVVQKEIPSQTVKIMFAFLHQHGNRVLSNAEEVNQLLAA